MRGTHDLNPWLLISNIFVRVNQIKGVSDLEMLRSC